MTHQLAEAIDYEIKTEMEEYTGIDPTEKAIAPYDMVGPDPAERRSARTIPQVASSVDFGTDLPESEKIPIDTTTMPEVPEGFQQQTLETPESGPYKDPQRQEGQGKQAYPLQDGDSPW